MIRVSHGRFFEDLLDAEILAATPLRLAAHVVALVERRRSLARLPSCSPVPAPASRGAPRRGPLVILVAGAYRGGSWKTPLARAVATFLARRGSRVGFLCRGYRGADARPRRLRDAEDAGGAGDEAFAAFEELRSSDVLVAVARDVTAGIASLADREIVVVDGSARLPCEGGGLSLLATDGLSGAPVRWGLPVGPGRAAAGSADRCVVRVADGLLAGAAAADASYDLAFERAGGPARGVTLDEIQALSALLVVTTHARPHRFVEALARRDVHPVVHLALPDHADAETLRGGIARVAARRRFDGLLVPDKALLALRGAPLPAPLFVARCDPSLGSALATRLSSLAANFSE